MKARVWKGRDDGMWHFEFRNQAGRAWWTGRRSTWQEALSVVLDEIDPPWLRGARR